eukprot:s469_g5.t1
MLKATVVQIAPVVHLLATSTVKSLSMFFAGDKRVVELSHEALLRRSGGVTLGTVVDNQILTGYRLHRPPLLT